MEDKEIKIMLSCAAGMITSLLVVKMQEEAKKSGLKVKIWSVGEIGIHEEVGKFDVILLGPQIRYKLKEVEKLLDGKCPVAIIDMKEYGSLNGKAVLDGAIKLYHNFYNK